MPIQRMLEDGLDSGRYDLAKAMFGGRARYLPPTNPPSDMGLKCYELGGVLGPQFADIEQEAAIMSIVSQDPQPESAYFTRGGELSRGETYAAISVEHTDATLAQVLQAHNASGSQLSLHEKFLVMRNCAGAYSLLHKYGIIDPDLKPDNIGCAIDDTGKIVSVKRIDVGAAKRIESTSAFEALDEQVRAQIPLFDKGISMAGTRGYLSPEQYTTDAQVGYGTDSYSLGLLIYDLFIGDVALNPRDELENSNALPANHSRITRNMSLLLSERCHEDMNKELAGTNYTQGVPLILKFVNLVRDSLSYDIDRRAGLEEMYQMCNTFYEAIDRASFTQEEISVVNNDGYPRPQSIEDLFRRDGYEVGPNQDPYATVSGQSEAEKQERIFGLLNNI